MPITIDTTASALSNASLASDPKWFHSTLLTGNEPEVLLMKPQHLHQVQYCYNNCHKIMKSMVS